MVGILIWCAFLLYQIAFRSKLADPLRLVVPDFLMLVAAVLVAILSWRHRNKQTDVQARQYLHIVDDVITLNEKAELHTAEERTIWKISRADLERVYSSPTGGMRFVLITKTNSKRDNLRRFLGTKPADHILRPQDWVNIRCPSGLKPRALAFQFGTRKKLIATMLATDLGQALAKHGFL